MIQQQSKMSIIDFVAFTTNCSKREARQLFKSGAIKWGNYILGWYDWTYDYVEWEDSLPIKIGKRGYYLPQDVLRQAAICGLIPDRNGYVASLSMFASYCSPFRSDIMYEVMYPDIPKEIYDITVRRIFLTPDNPLLNEVEWLPNLGIGLLCEDHWERQNDKDSVIAWDRVIEYYYAR